MNLSLTASAPPRSESLAFLSLSPNDFSCFAPAHRLGRRTRTAPRCNAPKAGASTEADKAKAALYSLIIEIAESKSADEFTARRDRLFPQYVDLMLGLGRIVHALTDRAVVTRRVKSQLENADRFFEQTPREVCPQYLKDQALFAIWEIGKVVDLADFIHSRPPLPESKQEQDLQLSATCTIELLFGRMHLDALIYLIAAGKSPSPEIEQGLSEGLRHVVNGHVAIRLGAKLRQEIQEPARAPEPELDDEDRLHLAEVMALQEMYEY